MPQVRAEYLADMREMADMTQARLPRLLFLIGASRVSITSDPVCARDIIAEVVTATRQA
jgi:hypothetical protein